MIAVKGYRGQKVAVLGLGRSGLATAAALQAGEAEPLLWDDSPEARAKAEAEGFTLTDLTRNSALDGVAALITSPGIPHLYPAPHPVIARATLAGIPQIAPIGDPVATAPADGPCHTLVHRQVGKRINQIELAAKAREDGNALSLWKRRGKRAFDAEADDG